LLLELVSDYKGMAKRFFELSLEVVKENGLELYDLEYHPGQTLLRLYVMNKETRSADLNDCAKVDRAMSPFIEDEEWVPDTLTLEVSSPGVYRHLKSLDHFTMAQGERVALSLANKLSSDNFPGLPKKIAGQKKIIASLLSVNDDRIEIECNGFKLNIELDEIKKANVEPLWETLAEKK
jgi:ribosome maturation factor RimP